MFETKKSQNTSYDWVEELLPPGYLRKRMFGGFSYYVDHKIVLATFDAKGDRQYKNQAYDFDIWNGCLFPTERMHHSKIQKKIPALIPHPVLSKWLYLPISTENFEIHIEEILKEIRKKSELFGVLPKKKKPKTSKEPTKINFRTPQIFRDEPATDAFQKAEKISDLKNLGPATEKKFHKAGIRTVDQFIKLGWKKALTKLVQSNKKNRHSIFAYALIGALSHIEWNRITENEKDEAKKFVASLKDRK